MRRKARHVRALAEAVKLLLLEHLQRGRAVGVGSDDVAAEVGERFGGGGFLGGIEPGLGASLAIIDKRREGPNEAEVMNIIGSVKGKRIIILDDMIDTAGTVVQAARAMKEAGALEVSICCTHPVLSGPALERIEDSEIKEVIVTDTIPLSDRAKTCKKIKVLSVSGILGEAVRRIYYNDSVSSLFI